MKSSLLLASAFFLSLSASAAMYSPMEEAAFEVTDNQVAVANFMASELALPSELHAKIIGMAETYKFTVLKEQELEDIFEEFKVDPNARMKVAGGACATRRKYVQDKLRTRGISTGQLYLRCNYNKGGMSLQDRVSGRVITYSNYHDVGVALVETNQGPELRVLDIQFEDAPVSLSYYLGEVESNQKIKPDSNNPISTKGPGTCFWSVNSPSLSSKSLN